MIQRPAHLTRAPSTILPMCNAELSQGYKYNVVNLLIKNFKCYIEFDSDDLKKKHEIPENEGITIGISRNLYTKI